MLTDAIKIFSNGNEPEKRAVTVHYSGYESCGANHSFGPAIRNHYLLHFVIEGRGTLEKDAGTYRISAGHGFFIAPSEVTTYYADHETPWTYYWAGFSGTESEYLLNAAGITRENPVFQYDLASVLPHLERLAFPTSQSAGERALALVGDLYHIFSLLAAQNEKAQSQKARNTYIYTALSYIEQNYSYPVTVQSIADVTGVSRSHLYRLFLSELGISVQQYLLQYRLQMACSMLVSSKATTEQICFSCGFTDVSHFAKIFKSKIGLTPGKYRKTMPQRDNDLIFSRDMLERIQHS